MKIRLKRDTRVERCQVIRSYLEVGVVNKKGWIIDQPNGDQHTFYSDELWEEVPEETWEDVTEKAEDYLHQYYVTPEHHATRIRTDEGWVKVSELRNHIDGYVRQNQVAPLWNNIINHAEVIQRPVLLVERRKE